MYKFSVYSVLGGPEVRLASRRFRAVIFSVLAAVLPARADACLALLTRTGNDNQRFFVLASAGSIYVHDTKYDGVPVILVRLRRGKWVEAGLIHERAYVVSEMRRRQFWGDTGLVRKENDRVRAVRPMATAIFSAQTAHPVRITSRYILAADLNHFFFLTESGYAVFSVDGRFIEHIAVIWPDTLGNAGPIIRNQLDEYLRHFYDQDPRQ